MKPPAEYDFKNDVSARHAIARARAEGWMRGRRALIFRLLRAQFGPLPDRIQNRLLNMQYEKLEDTVVDQIFTARSLEEALGSLYGP